MVKRIFLLIPFIVQALLLFGHPGHGKYGGQGAMHYLTSQFHLALLGLIVIIGLLLFVRNRIRSN